MGNRIQVTPGFFLLAAALWALDGKLLAAFALAAGLHELGHLAALWACGKPARRLRLTAMGAVIETGLVSYGQEFCCAVAGPLVNLGLFFALRRSWTMAAVVSLGLGVFNLLPVWPLDGGRALAALAGRFMRPEEGTVVMAIASGAALTALGAAAVAASWWYHMGVWPVLFAGWAVLRATSAKRGERPIPCKYSIFAT